MKKTALLLLVLLAALLGGCKIVDETSPTEPQAPTVVVCGDGLCNASAGELPQNCPSDCGDPPVAPFCGDGACDDGESQLSCPTDCGNPPPPPEPNAIVVEASGSCVGLVSAIQCEDESICSLDGAELACASIRWDVESVATGAHAGSSTGQPLERVQINGLPAGSYSIRQRTVATDGESDDQIHNVTVTDP